MLTKEKRRKQKKKEKKVIQIIKLFLTFCNIFSILIGNTESLDSFYNFSNVTESWISLSKAFKNTLVDDNANIFNVIS